MKGEIIDFSMFEIANLKDEIPKASCIYFLFNDWEMVYIGITTNLKRRINVHDINLNSNTYVGDKKIDIGKN